ncbi:alpha/beta hydrolase family protein [Streptomyces sp. NPDC059009]|uniref:alpha/beta hydrolase family protein n=1 Tax=Streptomyces sp. NPDC059009 TaxID=3346694 RepID=UPI0036B6CDED
MRNRARDRAAMTVLALTLALPLAGAGSALAAPADPARSAARPASTAPATARIELPRPTGEHAVGRDTLHLVDKSRRDPWVPSAGARELMVSMFYPAKSPGGRPTSYLSTEEARLLLRDKGLEGKVPPEAISATGTHARGGSRPVHGRFPLVVLSPGFTMPRALLTNLAEDLASRGYVVATVDHAYESTGTAFPGGRILTCVACESLEKPGTGKKITEGRAEDISFVLDRLTGRHSAWAHARMIDRQRIGAAGHSIGGAAALATMTTDRRVRAGVNMDGSFHTTPKGLGKRPFMMLGTRSMHHPGGKDESWDRTWAGLDGWKRWLSVSGTGHSSFTDAPVLLGQLGVDDPEAPLSWQRSEEITRAYVAAFFDQHLKGEHQPLLDGPMAPNPEVVFQRP